jgi:hypothetical protein
MSHPPTAGPCRSINLTQPFPWSVCFCSAREINIFLPAKIQTCAVLTGGRRANKSARATELTLLYNPFGYSEKVLKKHVVSFSSINKLLLRTTAFSHKWQTDTCQCFSFKCSVVVSFITRRILLDFAMTRSLLAQSKCKLQWYHCLHTVRRISNMSRLLTIPTEPAVAVWIRQKQCNFHSPVISH